MLCFCSVFLPKVAPEKLCFFCFFCSVFIIGDTAAPSPACSKATFSKVNFAYEAVKEADGLAISKEGSKAMKLYDERIVRVETMITARLGYLATSSGSAHLHRLHHDRHYNNLCVLRDQLGTAQNAYEMFRIFSRFNALLVRPHIAIGENQTQLIQRVKDDVEMLHKKFNVQYNQLKACKMSHVWDLPLSPAPSSGPSRSTTS